MIDPISFLARKIALRKHISTVPTGLIPLKSIHRVTMLVDGMDTDSDSLRGMARRYFSSRGISLNTVFLQRSEVNWHGLPKHPDISNPDLFLSFVTTESFTADYIARCSTARFKVGRRQLDGDVFDVVIADPEGQLFPLQTKAFETVAELLSKVR